MIPSLDLCPNCYNNPPIVGEDWQYWHEDGMKVATALFLHRKSYDEYHSLCWRCFTEMANQHGAEYDDELRSRLYREWRRDMLEEKDNLDRAARMTKELRNRVRAEA